MTASGGTPASGRRADADPHPPVGTGLRTRLLASFVYRFVATMTVPFFAIYLADRRGGVLTGLLMVVVAVVAVVAVVLGGPLCDRVGRRPVLVTGELVTALAFLGTAAASTAAVDRPLLAYGCFLLMATVSALIMPAHDATIVDVTTEADRRRIYSINYWSINIALASGTLLGGLLYRSWFAAVLAGAGLVSGTLALITWRFLAETRPAAAPGRRAGGLLRGYRTVLADRRFTALIVAATLVIAIELQLTSYIAVRLSQDFPEQPLLPGLGAVSGVQMLAVLRLENTLLVAGLALLVWPLLRRAPDRIRLIGGLLVFTAGYAVLTVSNTAWVLLVAMVVVTVGELANVPVTQSLVANATRADKAGTYMAAYGLNGNIGWVIASACISLGAVIGPVAMAALFVVAGIVAIVVFTRMLAVTAQQPRASSAR